MARRLFQSFVIAFLAAVSASAPAVQAAQAAEITVGGRVTDVLGRPLAEADVLLMPSLDLVQQTRLSDSGKLPKPAARAVTDADGRFRLAAPQAGLFKVRV